MEMSLKSLTVLGVAAAIAFGAAPANAQTLTDVDPNAATIAAAGDTLRTHDGMARGGRSFARASVSFRVQRSGGFRFASSRGHYRVAAHNHGIRHVMHRPHQRIHYNGLRIGMHRFGTRTGVQVHGAGPRLSLTRSQTRPVSNPVVQNNPVTQPRPVTQTPARAPWRNNPILDRRSG
jgi:hypothetical protein